MEAVSFWLALVSGMEIEGWSLARELYFWGEIGEKVIYIIKFIEVDLKGEVLKLQSLPWHLAMVFVLFESELVFLYFFIC